MNDTDIVKEDTTNKTVQTVFIIILIIIAIVAFIFLLVYFIDIPPPVFTPFVNGSVIKIKSVASDRYIRLKNCADYPSCTLNTINNHPVCPNGEVNNILAIDADVNSATEFALYQYQASNPALSDNIAMYYMVVPNSTFGLTTNFDSILVASANTQPPAMEVVTPLSPPDVGCYIRQYNFQFDLIESNNSINAIPGTGTYFIHTAEIPGCTDPPERQGTAYWYNNNVVSANSSPNCANIPPTTPCCPLVVQLVANPTNQKAITEILNYSFVVEVTRKIVT